MLGSSGEGLFDRRREGDGDPSRVAMENQDARNVPWNGKALRRDIVERSCALAKALRTLTRLQTLVRSARRRLSCLRTESRSSGKRTRGASDERR